MKYIAICVGCVLVAMATSAQERLVLNTPVYKSEGVSEFRLSELYLARHAPSALKGRTILRAIFREVVPGTTSFVNEGKTIQCEYVGADAEKLLIALNRADLSVKSLERRVTERCQQDGQIGAGQIVGSPQ